MLVIFFHVCAGHSHFVFCSIPLIFFAPLFSLNASVVQFVSCMCWSQPFCFLFHPIDILRPSFLTQSFSRNSYPGSHVAGSSPPSPHHCGSCLEFLTREDDSSFFPRRLASNCVPTQARRCQQLILFHFANKFKISPRRDTNSRTNRVVLTVAYSIRRVTIAAFVVVLWLQSLYLSRTKNQRGHWVCWISPSRKNSLMWRTHTQLIDRQDDRLHIPVCFLYLSEAYDLFQLLCVLSCFLFFPSWGNLPLQIYWSLSCDHRNHRLHCSHELKWQQQQQQ